MASTKKAPAKKPVAAKKPAAKAAVTKKATATKANAAAKPKKAAAKKVPADYRLNAIRKLASEYADKETRDLIEQVCLDLSRQAHALLVASTDDGIAYRNFLKSVSQAAHELASAGATGTDDDIEAATLALSDELDYSPVLDTVHPYFDSHGKDVYRTLQNHLRIEEVDLAFLIR